MENMVLDLMKTKLNQKFELNKKKIKVIDSFSRSNVWNDLSSETKQSINEKRVNYAIENKEIEGHLSDIEKCNEEEESDTVTNDPIQKALNS